MSFENVRRLGLALEGVEESTAYGAFALKIRGSLLACQAINKSAEPDSLAVWIDFDQRDALLAEAPETYYITDHYVNGPVVLVRLSRVRTDELRDLLSASWRFVTSQQRHAAPKLSRKTMRRKKR